MDPHDLDLPTLTALAGGGIVRAILERMAEEGYDGVRPSHGYVVQRLVDDEPTIGALAEALGMTQQGASKQVKDLEARGYVERVAVPGDQRARRVRLTDRGRGLLDAGRRSRSRLEDELVAKVGPDDVAAARRALAALLELVGLGERVQTRSVPMPD